MRRDVAAVGQATSTEDEELPDAVSLDAIVEQLVPTKARDSGQLRIRAGVVQDPVEAHVTRVVEVADGEAGSRRACFSIDR